MKKIITILLILNSFQIVTVAQITITETRNDTDIVYTTDRRGYVTNIQVIVRDGSKVNKGEADGYTTCPQEYDNNYKTTRVEEERKTRNRQRRRILANATIDALLQTSVIIMQDSYRMRRY